MNVYPPPTEAAAPYNRVQSVDLDGNQRAVMTWEPENSGSVFYLPALAATKTADAVYTVKTDGARVYGPAETPPTDIDDMGVTFVPSQTFRTKLEVIIDYLGTGTKTFHVQPVGFEEVQ